ALLGALAGGGPVDRSGDGLAVEVYPAAALRLWGLPARRYKGPSAENGARRRALVAAFAAQTAAWLALDDAQVEALGASDHLFDALVAAVVARARLLGRTIPVPNGAREAARLEGWIHLPEPGPLAGFDPDEPPAT